MRKDVKKWYYIPVFTPGYPPFVPVADTAITLQYFRDIGFLCETQEEAEELHDKIIGLTKGYKCGIIRRNEKWLEKI